MYDGWNLVMELDGMNSGGAGVPPVIRKYTWGLDLAGQSRDGAFPSRDREGAGSGMQSAGGIGGLLAVEDHSGGAGQGGTGVPPVSYLVFSDANGNVGQLIDWRPIEDWEELELSNANDWHESRLAARYEYDPYGNSLLDPTDANISGPYADDNPFRFSTKYLDPESGQYHYGHRYLDPPLGRWTSRDPIEERGGTNLYAFVMNQPSTMSDPLGLSCCCCCAEDLTITNIIALNHVGRLAPWGHSFHASLRRRWISNTTGRGRCYYHWYEWTTMLDGGKLQQRGQVVRRWQDWAILWPDNPQWDPLRVGHHCPGSNMVRVHDEPTLNQVVSLAGRDRTLYIGIQVISSPLCNCANKAVTAKIKQELSLDGSGLGDRMSFEVLSQFPIESGNPPGPGW